MKSTAIETILTELTEDYDFDGMINVYTANRMYTLNGDANESGDDFRVIHDDNILCIKTEQGTQWIDCDCITSIEIQDDFLGGTM